MKILGIESAALTASVALVTDGILTAEYTVTDKKTHSQTLLPMLDELKRSLGLELETLDAIAISAGPGSFTGLRIRDRVGAAKTARRCLDARSARLQSGGEQFVALPGHGCAAQSGV